MERTIRVTAETGQVFEWDVEKNDHNITKHGFDFVDAARVFGGTIFVRLDDREDYGEDRWLATGMLDGRIVVVVYAEPSENVIRIVSMRKALPREQKNYEEYL